MPTYEYKCQNCGHQFEKLQKISDPPGAECPRCDGIAERLISGGAGLLFKGSGFYITDYRSKSYQEAEKKEKKKPQEKAASGEPSAAAGPKKEPKKEPKQVSKKDSD